MRAAGRLFPLLAAALAASSGCGFLNAVAEPQATTAPPSAATSAAAPTGAPPPTIVDGDLRTTGGDVAGHLVVTLGTPRTGLEPPIVNSGGCHFDAASLQYLPVEFASTAPGLAAHVAVSRGPATPPDVGDVGIFVESGNGEQVYCTHSPPLPTRDTFFNQSGARTITAWVVLGHAVTPATPTGRPEVFETLQLRISDLRQLSDATTVQRSFRPGTLAVGAACADDPRAICVPLG